MMPTDLGRAEGAEPCMVKEHCNLEAVAIRLWALVSRLWLGVSSFGFQVSSVLAERRGFVYLKLETRNCFLEFRVEQELAIAFRAQDGRVNVIRLLRAELN